MEPDIQPNRTALTVIVGLVAFAGGAYMGYILGKKDGKITVVPSETENTEAVVVPVVLMTDQVREEIEDIYFDSDPLDEEDIQTLRVDNRVRTNVFASNDNGWIYDDELALRTGVDPYVIHEDEYISDEMDFKQSTMTYYEGDDVMADSVDTVVYGHAGLLGPLKFGHGTRDPNVVYIRNETMQMEWEVLRHHGHYAIEVLGLEADEEIETELRHSRAVSKFRRE